MLIVKNLLGISQNKNIHVRHRNEHELRIKYIDMNAPSSRINIMSKLLVKCSQ